MNTKLDIHALGEQIEVHGVAAQHEIIGELAEMVATIAPGTAEVLRDRFAPEVLRQRAFSVAASLVAGGRTPVLVTSSA